MLIMAAKNLFGAGEIGIIASAKRAVRGSGFRDKLVRACRSKISKRRNTDREEF